MGSLFACFPHGTKLDNQIFSDDEDVVPCETNPVQSKAGNNKNNIGKDILGMVLFWVIAVSGGTKIGKTKAKKEPKNFYK